IPGSSPGMTESGVGVLAKRSVGAAYNARICRRFIAAAGDAPRHDLSSAPACASGTTSPRGWH
ncbi:hypothetical protein, partial [Rhizobium lentis]